MNLHNHLPHFIECIKKWENIPSEEIFDEEYAVPLAESTDGFFEGYYSVLRNLDWPAYRENALKLDPKKMEERFLQCLQAVEGLFGLTLEGDAFLLGTFEGMDGYARFDRGVHQVYLGVDESHLRGNYLEILMAHELTHVARESRAEVWEGFGLNPRMTQEEFTESQPVIEHLFGEGLSCAVSEILYRGEFSWDYVYQTEKSFRAIEKNSSTYDQMIHHELAKPIEIGDYGKLYGIRPIFSHYVWAWAWVKEVLKDFAQGQPKPVLTRCSKDFYEHALSYRLRLK